MELDDRIASIHTRRDFAQFVADLRRDLRENPDRWEQDTLDGYLDAMSAWLIDNESFCRKYEQPYETEPSWRFFAQILWSASAYE